MRNHDRSTVFLGATCSLVSTCQCRSVRRLFARVPGCKPLHPHLPTDARTVYPGVSRLADLVCSTTDRADRALVWGERPCVSHASSPLLPGTRLSLLPGSLRFDWDCLLPIQLDIWPMLAHCHLDLWLPTLH